MPPLVLEGTTLGKRHQHYNQLLKEATSTNKHTPAKIDYDKTDIENLFNIDIASNNRDVEYILDVLKGQDMLYVSRAIKRSNWLINDDQFAHIINPEYLHLHLFPQMMPKASCKLLLHIRLTLKNESRVEMFFQYFREKNLKTALKWLPSCSISFIEDFVGKHDTQIFPNMLKRLCERSSTVLKFFFKGNEFSWDKNYGLKAAMFLLHNDTELYLDALKDCPDFIIPHFGKKHTKIVMKTCPHKFIDDFEKFVDKIDLATFAKYLNKEDIQSFLLKQFKNKELKSWFKQKRLCSLIKYIPKEGRLEFTKKYIDKSSEIFCTELEDDCDIAYTCAMSFDGEFGSINTRSYRWYELAPFDVAFADLKKMIRAESNPDERNAMLMILVTNARRNLAHIHYLLQYYRERHINEPFRFKAQFVNELLQKTAPHLYNDKIWNILEEIFHSMEVYIESGNNVQTCVKSIIVYKVTHDEPVPDVIEQKFIFDSLKPFYRNMNQVQKNKVFNYLFNIFLKKLNKHEISDAAKLAEYVEILKIGLILLKDCNKELIEYQILINKIKYCVKIKKEKGWDTSLTPLYDIKKSWKKYIFEDSLALAASEKVCMNALKHDPELLTRYKDLVDELCCNDAVRLERVLGKLRVYWPDTMASEWTSAYRERLDKPGGHKALVRGLCSLLNQRQLLDFVKTYEPLEAKIKWLDINEHELSLRKNIAQSMHIARPQITPEAILWYAKGDYVQFAQPSLNAILYNLRSSHSREYLYLLTYLLGGMISLQKHGIRLACKLSTNDIKQLFLDVWKSNKNSSVRAALFQNTHELLCRERDELLVTKLWELMQTFIDDLSAEENKTIYNTFGKLVKVHPKIKPVYYMKSYKFLKLLPPKTDCKNIAEKMKEEMNDIIEELDSEFVGDIILEFVDDVLLKKSYELSKWNDMRLFISYLLCVNDESTQFQRYEKVFIPFMDKSLSSWYKVIERDYVRQNFYGIIEELCRYISDLVLKQNKVMPTALFRNILTKLENSLPFIQNYNLFRQLKLTITFLDVLDKNKSDCEPIIDDSVIEKLHLTTVSIFVNEIVHYLKEDIDLHGPFIYPAYALAFQRMLESFNISESIRIKYVLNFLNEKDCVPIYLLVIKILDRYYEVGDNIKPEVLKAHKMLQSHPSPEVQTYYYEQFGDRRPNDDM